MILELWMSCGDGCWMREKEGTKLSMEDVLLDLKKARPCGSKIDCREGLASLGDCEKVLGRIWTQARQASKQQTAGG